MGNALRSRRATVFAGIGAVAVIAGVTRWPSRVAEAQDEIAETVPDYSTATEAVADPAYAPELGPGYAPPGTPVVTPVVEAPAPLTDPAAGGTIVADAPEPDFSTHLGGSDVAVASTGESHQVDAPRRKRKRTTDEDKRP
ncbi:MAG: hypothetical protein QM692_04410 [Thermomicrobiales bacterium]